MAILQSSTTTNPIQIHEEKTSSERWMVQIFNNDHTPVDVVITTLMVATRCDIKEAAMEVWEAEHYGKAPVHFAAEEECRTVAQIISKAGIRAEVSREWND